MSCLLEVDEPTVCGDIIQSLCFGFAHASVFTQIFVKGHIGQLFNVPFDGNVSESDNHLKDCPKLVLT